MNKEYYLQRLNDANHKLEEFKTKSNKLSHFRLISFILFLFSIIVFLINEHYLYLIISVIFLGVFIALVIIHNMISKNINYYQLLIETLNEYIYRFDNRWMSFNETGSEFNNNELPFLQDLDIIGETSLFKYLNICKTKNAKQKLVDRLSNPYNTKEELLSKQKSMQELSNNIDFSLNFQIALKDYRNQRASLSLNKVTKYLEDEIEFSKTNIYISILLTILSLITGVLSVFDIISFTYFVLLFVLQLLYSSLYLIKYKDVFQQISNLSLSIVMLDSIYKVIDKEKFSDETLNTLQKDINNYGLVGIKEINKIKNIESYNKFFVTYLLFNGLFSLNILIIYYFKKFIDNYGVDFSKSVDALEDFEVCTSLAILGQTKKGLTLPLTDENIKINFTNLKHPLITEIDCAPNSLKQESNINIITGSNMSGKTSFLRTVGINLILMNAGSYCQADSFSSPYLRVFTSMRIADDITKGVSTFYAELLRIKAAIEYSKVNKPMVIFIDEIFKGTNSNDRIQGAISLIEKLNKHNIIIFISTHDFELCEIKSVNIRNYHFSEYYEEDKIKFDYKLKSGRCNTTNAKYLMKIAGIID
jgi:hypothetical protein